MPTLRLLTFLAALLLGLIPLHAAPVDLVDLQGILIKKIERTGTAAVHELTQEGQTFRILMEAEDGYSNLPKSYILPAGDDSAPGVFKADIQVLLPDGKPAADAWVCAPMIARLRTRDDWSFLRVKTDARGMARLRLPCSNPVFANRPILAAEFFAQGPDGSGLISNPTYWVPGQSLVMKLVDAPQRNFRIVDASGNPLTPAPMNVLSIPTTRPWPAKPLKLLLSFDAPVSLPPGSYIASIGHLPRDLRLTTDSPSEITIDFSNSTVVSGRVLDLATGKPMADACVLGDLRVDDDFTLEPQNIHPSVWEFHKPPVLSKPTASRTQTFNYLELRTNIHDRELRISACTYTDSHGQYKIPVDHHHPRSTTFFMPGMLITGSGRIPHNYPVAPDLYACPAAYLSVTLSSPETLPRNTLPGNKIEQWLDFSHPANPDTLAARLPAIERLVPAGESRTNAVPAGFPFKYVAAGREGVYESDWITLKPGETFDLGKVLFTALRKPARFDFGTSFSGDLPNVLIDASWSKGDWKTSFTTLPSSEVTLFLPPQINPADLLFSLRDSSTPMNSISPPRADKPSWSVRFPLDLLSRGKGGLWDATILDALGRPLAGSTVEVRTLQGPRTLTVADNGFAQLSRFNNISPYAITLTTTSGQRCAVSFGGTAYFPVLAPGPTPPQTPAPVTGRVVDSSGRGVANCALVLNNPPKPYVHPPRVFSDTQFSYMPQTLYTDSDGKFSIQPLLPKISPDPLPDHYLLNITPPGALAPLVLRVKPGDHRAAIALSPTRPVKINVTPAPGKSTSGGTRLRLMRHLPEEGLDITLEDFNPRERVITFNLPDGTYFLASNSYRSASVTLASGATRLQLHDITYPTINLNIYDSTTGKSVPNVTLLSGVDAFNGDRPFNPANFDDAAWRTLESTTEPALLPKSITGDCEHPGITHADAQGKISFPPDSENDQYRGFPNGFILARGYMPMILSPYSFDRNKPLPEPPASINVDVPLIPAGRINIQPTTDATPSDPWHTTLEDPDYDRFYFIQCSYLPPDATAPTDRRDQYNLDKPAAHLHFPMHLKAKGGNIIIPTHGSTFIYGANPPGIPQRGLPPRHDYTLADNANPLFITENLRASSWIPTPVRAAFFPKSSLLFLILDPTGKPIPDAALTVTLNTQPAGTYFYSDTTCPPVGLCAPQGARLTLSVTHKGVTHTRPEWTFTVPTRSPGATPREFVSNPVTLILQ